MSKTYCNNCLRESHCDSLVKIKVNASEVGINEEIICKQCRCNKCKGTGAKNG